MAKRFTETDKWKDPWFLDLTADQKILWIYLCDMCDGAGVIDFSNRHAAFMINGESDPLKNLEVIGQRIITLEDN